MILITGATGNIGVELVKKLLGRGHPIRVFVRNRAQAQAIALPGIEVAEGDFTKPETFLSALEGVDRLFLLIPSSAEVEQQQRNFVDAAKRSEVRHIVKLSQLAADEHASTVSGLTGSEPISFHRFAQDYAGGFLGKAAGAR
jgi:uncharacterized protein YbjT (DUF2867 family)